MRKIKTGDIIYVNHPSRKHDVVTVVEVFMSVDTSKYLLKVKSVDFGDEIFINYEDAHWKLTEI